MPNDGEPYPPEFRAEAVRLSLQPDLAEQPHGSHAGQGWVYVAVADPDAHFQHAKAAGVEVLGDPHDAMGGYSARDLEGNLWSFGTGPVPIPRPLG